MSAESLRVAKQLSQEAVNLAALARREISTRSDSETQEAIAWAILALEKRVAVVGVILDARLSELGDRR